jgi:hypothetical protein
LKIRVFQAAVHLGDLPGATAAVAEIVSKKVLAQVGPETAMASAWESLRELAAWELANMRRPLACVKFIVKQHARKQAVALEHTGEFGFDAEAAGRLSTSKPWHRASRGSLVKHPDPSDSEHSAATVAGILFSVATDERQRAMVYLVLQALTPDAAKDEAGVSGKELAEFRTRAAAALQHR